MALKQRCDEVSGVEAALLCGSQHGREDLLRLCPADGPIAAAARFARDDSGAERVFGAPIRGVERGIKEEAEDGIVFRD